MVFGTIVPCKTQQLRLQVFAIVEPPGRRWNPHLEPRFPDGGGLGGFVSFAYGAVGSRGCHPIEGAIPLPPPLGEGLMCGRGVAGWQRWAWQWRGGRMCGGRMCGGGSGGWWRRRAATGNGGRGSGGRGSGRRGSGRRGSGRLVRLRCC